MSNNSEVLPWVIPEYCKGCTNCVSACRRELLFMIETEQEGAFVPWMDDVDHCTGCGMCEAACAWSAICLTSYVEKARERFIKDRPLSIVRALKLNTQRLKSEISA